jgi:hypothetical protein
MMKNGMSVEAVDVAYTFGVEEKFPPQEILTSFLRKSKEAWKRTRTVAHGSPMVLVWSTVQLLISILVIGITIYHVFMC